MSSRQKCYTNRAMLWKLHIEPPSKNYETNGLGEREMLSTIVYIEGET